MKISEKLAIAVEALERISNHEVKPNSRPTDPPWVAFLALQQIAGSPSVERRIPTVEEVAAYIEERKALGKTGVDAEKWHAHYSANGWMVGRNKMKDWKAAVRTWEKEAPKYKPISRRLEPDDCVDAVAFDLWWQQQEVIEKTEHNRVLAHSIRIGGVSFDIIKQHLVALAAGSSYARPVYEEEASRQIRELQQRQPVRAARVISRD